MVRAILLTLLLIPSIASALDIGNAKRINKSCALCHGVYGQGTPGTLAPRLAGLPAKYLAKELKFYRSGHRNYNPMTISSSIRGMSDKDINDISNYLAGINLRNLNLPKIPYYPNGDQKEGKKEFGKECKTCHGSKGLGKEKKGAPPLAGQYGTYIFSQMKKFQSKDRYHDDDPEDETFDDYADNDLDDLISFVTKLPPHAPLKELPDVFALGMNGMSSEKVLANIDGMVGMVSMESMQTTKSGEEAKESGINWSQGALKISGHFRVTPTGEILLNPTNQDLREVAGTSGKFKIVPGGILFIPQK